jgi:capsular polysaccharide biosynthesis protein
MLQLILLRLAEAYFRHRWVVLLPLVILVVIGGVSLALTKPTLTARGTIYVQRTSLLASLTAVRDEGYTWVTPAQSAQDDYRELLQTEAFLRLVAKSTEFEAEVAKGQATTARALTQVKRALSVDTIGKHMIVVRATHRNGTVAKQLATATIEGYLRWKINADQQESVSAQTFFASLIATYEQEADNARGELLTYLLEYPDPVRGERPTRERVEIERRQLALELAEKRKANAMEKEENARLEMTKSESDVRQSYQVIDAPREPDAEAFSKKAAVLKLGIFAVAGAMLSAGMIVAFALLDRSAWSEWDVRQATGLPVLCSLVDAPGTGLRAQPQAEALSKKD